MIRNCGFSDHLPRLILGTAPSRTGELKGVRAGALRRGRAEQIQAEAEAVAHLHRDVLLFSHVRRQRDTRSPAGAMPLPAGGGHKRRRRDASRGDRRGVLHVVPSMVLNAVIVHLNVTLDHDVGFVNETEEIAEAPARAARRGLGMPCGERPVIAFWKPPRRIRRARLHGNDRHSSRRRRRSLRADPLSCMGRQTGTPPRVHGVCSRGRCGFSRRRSGTVCRPFTPGERLTELASLVAEIAGRAATGWSLYRDAAAIDPEIAADWNELQLLRHQLVARVLKGQNPPNTALINGLTPADSDRHRLGHRQPRKLRPPRPPSRLRTRRIPQLDETDAHHSHTRHAKQRGQCFGKRPVAGPNPGIRLQYAAAVRSARTRAGGDGAVGTP